MKIIPYFLIFFLILMSCDNRTVVFNNEREIVTDTLFIGKGLKLEKPFRIEYDKVQKGPLSKGRIYIGDSVLYSFHLEYNLVDDIPKPVNWIIQDTVSTTLRKDTMIFNWYRKNGMDWIAVKYIYTHASGSLKQYSIYGYSKLGQEFQDELCFLYSEIRRVELIDFFDHDSIFIRNIVQFK